MWLCDHVCVRREQAATLRRRARRISTVPPWARGRWARRVAAAAASSSRCRRHGRACFGGLRRPLLMAFQVAETATTRGLAANMRSKHALAAYSGLAWPWSHVGESQGASLVSDL